jgi:DNA gyrase subunit A
MSSFAKEIIPVNLEDEMKQSYLDYAMSVIVGRALPDVRDGLKPVHRRVLFAMHELGNDWNKPYKKSARVVGDVIGKYHPHGDSAVYDTIVRMAQPFSLRYMLIDGQGNFGSVDGDPPAAMRYTEVRMARIAHELLADLEKDTVDFTPNYDESEKEPSVLPTRVPNLLVNGSAGIAVGMATNIPPHNLTEVIEACLLLIANPDASIEDLMACIPGPDFPTAAIINGASGIREAYLTGRGRIYLRAKCEFEEDCGRTSIIVNELPYQVNKARLMEKIAELAKEGKLEGISGLRDESDKDGMRMVIELKRGEMPEVVLNNLYQQTAMQNVFGINMVALIDGRPRCLNLKEIIAAFIDHRREVVTRRTLFELRKARDRAHILEGLAVALANIDEVIELIKSSPSPAVARERLLERHWRPGVVSDLLARAEDAARSRPETLGPGFGLSELGYRLSTEQAQAILDLRLHRLTGLEQDKIIAEYREILARIDELMAILGSDVRLMEVIRDELIAIRDQFSDERRTRIVADYLDLSRADLITEEDMVVTVSHEGYVKSQPLSAYRAQRRGGRGKAATTMKQEDYIDKLIVANTHDTILCFSSVGKVYWLKVYELPVASRVARGKPFVNLLPLESGENINAILPIREFDDGHYVFMATASGIVKKVALKEFERPRSSGKIALDLRQDDRLVNVAVTDGQQHVMLFSNSGKAVCFHEDEVRVMGRGATGVRGMTLQEGQEIIALIIGTEGSVLNVTENGFGKRTAISGFPRHRRGGQGVITMQTNERNGGVVGAVLVQDNDELMLITDAGTLVRTRVEEIRELGRNTQGVMVIRLSPGEKVVGVDRIPMLEGEDDESSEYDNDEQAGIYNFSAGPSMLPTSVLEQARDELCEWHSTGMSVMEMSHRSKDYVGIAEQAEASFRALLAVPDNYKVLFLQGGATGQFAAVPMNLLRGKTTVNYVNTGIWSKKAISEAKTYAKVSIAASAEATQFSDIPDRSTWEVDPSAAYLHYTSNETIGGVEFHHIPDAGGLPLVSDMSSNILSRPIDISRFGLIYAGAQKNMGPAGITVVIVRDDLIGETLKGTPSIFDYKVQADNGSMLNTPPTYNWYLLGLVLSWVQAQGGLDAMDAHNDRKAGKLYGAIDASDF